MRKMNVLYLFVAVGLGAAIACSSDSDSDDPGTGTPLNSSRAYKGHQNEQDTNAFVTAYPATLGTRLDDCQTCHTGASFTYPSGDSTKSTQRNACDTCHLIMHPDPEFIEPQPTSYADTLNPYGQAYFAAGRTAQGLLSIGEEDSDGDGFSNA